MVIYNQPIRISFNQEIDLERTKEKIWLKNTDTDQRIDFTAEYGITVNIPEGTLLKPREPAALSCRTHALGRLFDVLGGLLGQGNPAFLNAAGFSDSPHFMYSGYDKNGEWYQLYQIGFGGVPRVSASSGR